MFFDQLKFCEYNPRVVIDRILNPAEWRAGLNRAYIVCARPLLWMYVEFPEFCYSGKNGDSSLGVSNALLSFCEKNLWLRLGICYPGLADEKNLNDNPRVSAERLSISESRTHYLSS